MWYGVTDLCREITGTSRDRDVSTLRQAEFFSVRDANFKVHKGECVALIGPNGAGKSTMLKMVNGLIRPNSGKISIRGKVGALIELGTGFNPILSGRENVYINGSVLGMAKREIDRVFDEIVEFAELSHVIDDPVKTYSSGMKVRLGFSVAANLQPDLLVMDEVLAVGDVGFRMKCFAHLRKLIDDGVSIIIVSHAVPMLARVANRAIVFGNGKIVHDGDFQTGSTVYEELMKVRHDSAKKESSKSESTSAGLHAITLLDSDGNQRHEFQTGEPLNVRIEVDCEKSLENARLIVALASPVHGVLASIATPHKQLELNLPEGRSVVTLKIHRPPMLVGAFHFNVSLYGPETIDFYHRLSYQAPFRITGPQINTDGRGISGIVGLDHDWSVE